MLVVTEVLSIASLKVTAIVELTETEVAESAGEDEETVGAVVSIINALFDPREPDEPGVGRVNVVE